MKPARKKKCPSVEMLRAFQCGNLSEAKLDAVAAHLERCPACEREAQRLDRVEDALIHSLRDALADRPSLPTVRPVSEMPTAPRPHLKREKRPNDLAAPDSQATRLMRARRKQPLMQLWHIGAVFAMLVVAIVAWVFLR